VGWDRLPRSLRAPMALSSPEERHKVVNEVLGMMALRTAQSYRVGSVEARIISGGQRKVGSRGVGGGGQGTAGHDHECRK
jgi:hypothetical protein